jgi:hypothetical protein
MATENYGKGIRKLWVGFSGSVRGKMRNWWHGDSRGFCLFVWKRELNLSTGTGVSYMREIMLAVM